MGFFDEWDSLIMLWRDPSLGPASKLAFVRLWHLAGGRPEYIVVRTTDLGATFGKSPRSAERWLGYLVEAGLVEVIDRDERRGTVHVFIFHPNPTDRSPRPDPQLQLPLEPAEEGSAIVTSEQPSAPEQPAIVTSEQPSAPEQPAIVTSEQPTAEAGTNHETLEKPGNRVLGNPPRSAPPLLDSPRIPRISLKVLGENLQTPHNPRNPRILGGAPDSVPKTAPLSGGSDEADSQADFEWRQAAAAFFAAVDDPQQRREKKEHLVEYISEGLGNDDMHKSIPGRAADMVIAEGLPFPVLESIIEKIREMRLTGELDKPARSYFKTCMINACEEAGITWPEKKRRT